MAPDGTDEKLKTPLNKFNVEGFVMCGAECSHEDDDENYVDSYFYERIDKECCPKCGCKKVTSVGNTESHPDNWTKWNCLNCNHLIAEIDNSPMHTCWEFEDCTIEW